MLGLLVVLWTGVAWAEEEVEPASEADEALASEAEDSPAEEVDPLRPEGVSLGLGAGVFVPSFAVEGSLRVRLSDRTTLQPAAGIGLSTQVIETAAVETNYSTFAVRGGLALRHRLWANARTDVPLVLGVEGQRVTSRNDYSPWVEIETEAERRETTFGVRLGVAVERWVAPGVLVAGGLHQPILYTTRTWDLLPPQTEPTVTNATSWAGSMRSSISVHVFP